jgi:hypothetical protein
MDLTWPPINNLDALVSEALAGLRLYTDGGGPGLADARHCHLD